MIYPVVVSEGLTCEVVDPLLPGYILKVVFVNVVDRVYVGEPLLPRFSSPLFSSVLLLFLTCPVFQFQELSVCGGEWELFREYVW